MKDVESCCLNPDLWGLQMQGDSYAILILYVFYNILHIGNAIMFKTHVNINLTIYEMLKVTAKYGLENENL